MKYIKQIFLEASNKFPWSKQWNNEKYMPNTFDGLDLYAFFLFTSFLEGLLSEQFFLVLL